MSVHNIMLLTSSSYFFFSHLISILHTETDKATKKSNSVINVMNIIVMTKFISMLKCKNNFLENL